MRASWTSWRRRLRPIRSTFRLKHLSDPRAIEAIKLAAERFGWDSRPKPADGIGYGFAFARYKNLAAYCAVALEIKTDRETGRIRVKRVVAAVDAGQVVNPDGVRNQIEGAILQSTSWTLYESVTFDETRVTSIDWATYPICGSIRCRTASRSILSTGRVFPSSVPAKPDRGRRRRQSPTPSPMRQASA